MQLLDSGSLSIFNTDLTSLYATFTGVEASAAKSYSLTEKFVKTERIRLSQEGQWSYIFLL